MKVLLVALNSKFVHSSLALRYLKSYCEQELVDLKIKEFTINESPGGIAGEIYELEPNLLAFSCYIWNLEESLAVAEIIKKVSPKTLIVFGGPEVSYEPREFMERYPFIDMVVFGEGEQTFKELLERIKVNSSLDGVPGLAYRKNLEIYIGKERALIRDLDSIPSPYQGELSFLKNKIVYMESSRGCPFRCQYCLSSTIQGVRYFSLTRTKAELNKLIEAGVKQIKFVDRTFNCDKGRAMEIFKFLAEAAPDNMNFHFEIAADLIDEEMTTFLATLPRGKFQFEIGVQSTNQKTLELIQRGTDLGKLTKVVKKLKANNNLHLHLDLIAGLPEEDIVSFKRSFDQVYRLEPHKLQLGFLKLLKGSGVRQRAKEYKYLYIDKPPYEVLGNKDVEYREVLQLKRIEKLVDQYLNSYRFGTSLPYLINNYFDSPFEFFNQLASFWLKQGYFEMAHSQVSLYQFLGDFFSFMDSENLPLFRELLKFDYLLQGGIWSLPEYFITGTLLSYEREAKERFVHFMQNEKLLREYVPHLAHLPHKQLGKNLKLQLFEFNVIEIMVNKEQKKVPKEVTPLIFDYYQRDKIFQRAHVFRLPIQ